MRIDRNIFSDRSGNFGMMTAILALPLIAGAGAVIDFAHVMDVRSRLMGAADAAALAAISDPSEGHKAASEMTDDGRVGIAETSGRSIFLSNAANSMTLSQENVDARVEKVGPVVSSNVSFSTEVPTYFLHLVGLEHVEISGTATASYALGTPVYADYHFLLDNSPSMGIGANPAAINDMIKATNCAFACHEVWENGGKPKANSNYNVARAKGIRLRIDDLQQAVLDTIDYSKIIHDGAGDRARFSAHTFGKNVLNGQYKIDRLSGLTGDATVFGNSIKMLTLMETFNSGHNKDALTSISKSLEQINTAITGTIGDGSSTSKREQVVLIVTDGVGNSLKSGTCTGVRDRNTQPRCFEPVDPAECKTLKDRGIKIAVMYTTYHALKDHLYETYVAQFSNRIGEKLKDCASPNLYAEVTIKDDMSAIMKKLFERATSARKLRLTS